MLSKGYSWRVIWQKTLSWTTPTLSCIALSCIRTNNVFKAIQTTQSNLSLVPHKWVFGRRCTGRTILSSLLEFSNRGHKLAASEEVTITWLDSATTKDNLKLNLLSFISPNGLRRLRWTDLKWDQLIRISWFSRITPRQSCLWIKSISSSSTKKSSLTTMLTMIGRRESNFWPSSTYRSDSAASKQLTVEYSSQAALKTARKALTMRTNCEIQAWCNFPTWLIREKVTA